jgi:nicotinamide-nucleotide amidase
MRAEIIAIGDELTTGQRLDTNSQWVAQRLLEIGVPVAFHTTVGDRLDDNVQVFRQACERAEIVVATGGLGPTADDLTRHALAEVAGVPLVQDDDSLAHIKALFARRKREMPSTNLIQAQFPQGSRPIHNPHGSAPGIDIEIPRRADKPARVFALPGVPAEMKEMWEASVRPAIQNLLGVAKVIAHHRIKCFGVGESDLEAMLPDLIARDHYPLVGITVHQATITLRITAEGETAEAARDAMGPTIETIRQCLGDLIFGVEEEELQDVVVRLLREQKKTLLIDEWATQGLVSKWLADCDSAGVFRFGMVHGDNRWWRDEFRDVKASGVDYHLLIGPAPNSDSSSRQAGNVVVVLSSASRNIRKEFPFAGHPEILRPRAAKQALNLLRLHLLGRE